MENQEEEKGCGSTARRQEHRVRELRPQTKHVYNKICSRLVSSKTDGNTFGQAMRLFTVPFDACTGFPGPNQFRILCGRAIASLYIFRFHQQRADNHTHGIHVRLNGFVHRGVFESLIQELVHSFIGFPASLKTVVPVVKKDVSLFDYLQSLYVSPSNLIVNYSHCKDAIAETLSKHQRQTSVGTGVLKTKMLAFTTQILDTMIAMPSKYPFSYLSHLLGMDPLEFRRHMRATTIQEITSRVAQDAYSTALQEKVKFKPSDVQELMDPITRRAMLNRCIGDKVTKQIQLLIQQTFGEAFVHPHPFSGIFRTGLPLLPPIDGLIFDPRFLFTILLSSRWFVRACMLEEYATSNNRAHLMLYGGAGTGKTFIASAIASSIPTYKFLVNSKFQNPDMLRASLLSIEEFDVSSLPGNMYKQLLDLKTHIKVDFKNLHPENVSEGMACMITTNDEVFGVLKAQKKFNKSSVDAALRRLYIVPVKAGPFERLHGRLSRESPYYERLACLDTRFDKESSKLQRIFNLILAFALFQSDVRGMYLDAALHSYFQKLVQDFKNTAFGTFYLSQKVKVDEIIQEVEHAMAEEDPDDSSYLVKVSTCVGQFQQLLYEFLTRLVADNPEVELAVVKDKTIPWPIKAYHLLSSVKFNMRLMWEMRDEADDALNEEVRNFLIDPRMQHFASGPQLQDHELSDVGGNAEDEFYESENPLERAPEKAKMAGENIPEEEILERFSCKRALSDIFGGLPSEGDIRNEASLHYGDCDIENIGDLDYQS